MKCIECGKVGETVNAAQIPMGVATNGLHAIPFKVAFQATAVADIGNPKPKHTLCVNCFTIMLELALEQLKVITDARRKS